MCAFDRTQGLPDWCGFQVPKCSTQSSKSLPFWFLVRLTPVPGCGPLRKVKEPSSPSATDNEVPSNCSPSLPGKEHSCLVPSHKQLSLLCSKGQSQTAYARRKVISHAYHSFKRVLFFFCVFFWF